MHVPTFVTSLSKKYKVNDTLIILATDQQSIIIINEGLTNHTTVK